MTENNVWEKAKTLSFVVSEDIVPGFNIGFDEKIPASTQAELRSFVDWVERNYRMPITLWVDFEYKHYLIRRDGERVGYLFYWSDFSSYPVFDGKNLPSIRLPVRTEHSKTEEILMSFIEAITDYFAWLYNEIFDGYVCDDAVTESILQAYLEYRKGTALAKE